MDRETVGTGEGNPMADIDVPGCGCMAERDGFAFHHCTQDPMKPVFAEFSRFLYGLETVIDLPALFPQFP
jgi:hypothetical protein